MSTNCCLLEKLAEANRQELVREAGQQRLLKGVPRSRFQVIRRGAASLGKLLEAVGGEHSKLREGEGIYA